MNIEGHQAVDSAVLKDGKFVFNLQEEIPPELYFIGDSPWHGGYVFLDGNDIKLTLEDVTEEQMCWEVKGSPLNEVYRRFEKVLYDETFGQIKDSLNALFYEARERQDREEMARIKNESMPYYDEGVKRERCSSIRIFKRIKLIRWEYIFIIVGYFSGKISPRKKRLQRRGNISRVLVKWQKFPLLS